MKGQTMEQTHIYNLRLDVLDCYKHRHIFSVAENNFYLYSIFCHHFGTNELKSVWNAHKGNISDLYFL